MGVSKQTAKIAEQGWKSRFSVFGMFWKSNYRFTMWLNFRVRSEVEMCFFIDLKWPLFSVSSQNGLLRRDQLLLFVYTRIKLQRNALKFDFYHRRKQLGIMKTMLCNRFKLTMLRDQYLYNLVSSLIENF